MELDALWQRTDSNNSTGSNYNVTSRLVSLQRRFQLLAVYAIVVSVVAVVVIVIAAAVGGGGGDG